MRSFIDIDECSSGSNNCHLDQASCANTIGSFACTCTPGYTGDGINCADIDECSSGSNNCHQDATCANTIGSFACTCKPGYTEDGINCADIDECSSGSNYCHRDRATCVNTIGSFACTYCAIGMESGVISDSAIIASSYFTIGIFTLPPANGRLNNEKAWASASQSAEEYLQIDLGRETTVTKVATQGHPDWYEWTKSYKIGYSTDLFTWKLYREGEQEKVFPGNTDRNTVVYGVLAQPIVARGIRIIVVTFQHWPALRVEVYECM
ncbi:EGF-like repeat and discoidin I-like domain-containing protein 3 [Nematostella vectensis]|uniref:EGF-like repeat and discoidin I-like domain-containing protein 3 n=1 Tax=Nematostella vectensis TaxID=45351 RepID=UPI0020772C5F|nr:EGF-like repeat and discoidin I-like domain-containing protein 3 [Nematostella vectensis]